MTIKIDFSKVEVTDVDKSCGWRPWAVDNFRIIDAKIDGRDATDEELEAINENDDFVNEAYEWRRDNE